MTEQSAPHNNDDAKAALIALAASQDNEEQSCPSSEELAAFVETPRKGEERQRILSHLGECSKCYEEWLSLHQHRHAEGRRRWFHAAIQLINSRKTLAWAGSVMGIAAAVVVFLQLRTDYVELRPAKKTESDAVSERVMSQQSMQMEDVADEDEAGKKKMPADTKQAEPAMKPAAKEEQRLNMNQQTGASGDKRRETERFMAPEVSSPPAAVEAFPVTPEKDPEGGESGYFAGESKTVFENLRDGCEARRWEKNFWQEMVEKVAQARNHGGDSTHARLLKRLAEQVALAAAKGGDENICSEIVAILESMR